MGILCDRRAPVKNKGMILKTVMSLVMMYGLEMAMVTKKQERQRDVPEMRLERFSMGMTRKDKLGRAHRRDIAIESGQAWTKAQTLHRDGTVI